MRVQYQNAFEIHYFLKNTFHEPPAKSAAKTNCAKQNNQV